MRDIYIVYWECEDGTWGIWGAFADEMDAQREVKSCQALFDKSDKKYEIHLVTEYLIGD